MASARDGKTAKPLAAAGTVLGIGMGGFVDGILLHQIAQVHAMFSARVPMDSLPNMHTNMRADGVFHAGLWIATAVGIAMLFNAAKRPDVLWCGRTLVGSMLFGWGLFNVVEGVIDHHLLGLHHVVSGSGCRSGIGRSSRPAWH